MAQDAAYHRRQIRIAKKQLASLGTLKHTSAQDIHTLKTFYNNQINKHAGYLKALTIVVNEAHTL